MRPTSRLAALTAAGHPLLRVLRARQSQLERQEVGSISTSGTSGLPAYALAAVVYAALILVMAQQMLAGFDTSVPVSARRRLENDALHSLWTMAWSTHALRTDPSNVFHANNFYPEPYTLAYSEHYLGIVPLFGPLWAASGSVVAALNAYYLLSFVLTGLITFALVRTWTGSLPGGLYAGVLFAFAPPRLAQHFHIQLLGAWWLPLTLLLLDRFLRSPTPLRAALAAVSFVMQWLCSIYLGWLLTFAAAVYLIAAFIAEPGLLKRPAIWLCGAGASAVSALVLLPTLLPYRTVADRWAFEWSLDEIVSHSATPVSYLNVSTMNLTYGGFLRAFETAGGVEQQLFLGFSPLALAIIGLGALARQRPAEAGSQRGPRWLAFTYTALLVCGLVLSFGPYAGASSQIPLPYLALYEWVPGFQAMRNPGRFIVLIALALAVLSGLGLAALLARISSDRTKRLVALAALVVLSLEYLSRISFEAVPQFDAGAQAYLRDTASDGAIVELPMSRDREVAETPRMLASTSHWRPTVNGFSSFRPPTYESLASIFHYAEPGTMADAMQAIDARTLVLHLDELTAPELDRFVSDEWREAGYVERFRSTRTAVWALESPVPPSFAKEVKADLQMPRQVTAGQAVSVRLVLQTDEGRLFHDPVGGVRPVDIEWQLQDVGLLTHRERRLLPLPNLIVSRPQVKTEFTLTAPTEPGRYRLVIAAEGLEAERSVMVNRGRGS